MAQVTQTAVKRETIEFLRSRVKSTKRQLDWLHQYRRADWDARRLAEIDAGLALARLAEADGR